MKSVGPSYIGKCSRATFGSLENQTYENDIEHKLLTLFYI